MRLVFIHKVVVKASSRSVTIINYHKKKTMCNLMIWVVRQRLRAP